MKRLLLLAAFALVASLIFATTAVAQDEEKVSEEVETPSGEATIEAQGPPEAVEPAVQQAEQQAVQPQMEQPQMKAEGTPQEEAKEAPKEEAKEQTMEKTGGPLPKSGGPGAGSLLLPGAALLLGSGILAYAVMRRR